MKEGLARWLQAAAWLGPATVGLGAGSTGPGLRGGGGGGREGFGTITQLGCFTLSCAPSEGFVHLPEHLLQGTIKRGQDRVGEYGLICPLYCVLQCC